MLKGYKTYAVAAIAAALAAAQVLGYPIPESVFVILGALGLTTVRHAIG